MRNFAFILLFLPTVLLAQKVPQVDVFGGYSFLHIDTQGVTGSTLDSDCNMISPGLCPAGTFHVHPNFNGWEAAIRFNLIHGLGIEADFSGNYGKPLTLSSGAQQVINSLGIGGFPPKVTSYNFLFGPVVHKQIGRSTPFVHGLFGMNRLASGTVTLPSGFGLPPSLSGNDTAFAMALGGGLDMKVARHLAVRVVQADYLYTGHDFSFGLSGIAKHQNNVRVSAGIVYSFGSESGQAPRPPSGTPSKPTPHGSVAVPELGISVMPSDRTVGCEILGVSANGPAAAAGLHAGDVVNQIDGRPVSNAADLNAALASIAPGTQVKVGFLIRGAWQTEAVVKLGSR
jgi:hypothetical protein